MSTAAQAQLIIGVTSALIAATLAYVTYLYYKETKAHTNEMQRARAPVVKPNIVIWNSLHARLTIENIGNGTARDVNAHWQFVHIDNEEDLQIPQLSPGESHMFLLPFEDSLKQKPSGINTIIDRLDGSDGILEVNIKYSDSFGERYDDGEFERTELNVLEILRSRRGEQLVDTELEKIENELGDMTKAIEK